MKQTDGYSFPLPLRELFAVIFLMAISPVFLLQAQPSRTPQSGDGGQELRNFHHTAWSSESGLGAVFDIQQSRDGYLWLTTSRGVFRFDGVRFESADAITGGAAQNAELNSVFVAASGDVWFRTRAPGLLLWKDGKLSAFPGNGCTPGLLTGSTVEDRDGTLWVAGSAGLFQVRDNRCELVSSRYALPGGFPSAIAIDRAGAIWLKMPSGKLFYLPRGAGKFIVSPHGEGPVGDFAYLHEGPNGSMWLSDELGLRRVSEGGSASSMPSQSPSHTPRRPRFGNFTFDSNGTLWAASSHGLLRIPQAEKSPMDVGVDIAGGQHFTMTQGLSSDVVWKLLSDREGSLWVATNSGLDQLRRNLISQVATPIISEHQFAIAIGNNQNVWIGSRSLPLTEVFFDGRNRTFSETSQVIAIRRDFKGGIWSSGLGKHLLWRAYADHLEPVSYPNDDREVVASIALDKNNELWLLTFGQNVYRRIGQTWVNQNVALGREPGILGTMESDPMGNIWFAFSNHVVEWDGSSYKKYTYLGKNRFPNALTVKGEHVWLGSETGVQLLLHGEFRMMRWKDASLPGRVSGIVETKTGDLQTGDLWISGFSGIVHVKADELAKWFANPDYAVSAESFDTLDGLPGLAAERFPEPSMVEAEDGRLWFATTKGIAWLDPASLERSYNLVPPTVLISSLVAGGQTYSHLQNLALPPRNGNIEIGYTALSLRIPERVQFRYRLEPIDTEWSDAGTRRQAYYTKLRPGNYTFRVIACNDHGVWNETGASFSFKILPAWYQSTWFAALCGLAIVLIVWMLYRLRVRQVAAALSARFDERLAERTRLARELHDTFLQTVQSSKMIAEDALREDTDEKRRQQTLEKLSIWLGRAVDEARAAVHSLRGSTTEKNHLFEALQRAAEEHQQPASMDIIFSAVGDARDMHPIVRDEIYRIADEAIRNAAAHSKASRLEIELRYANDLSLRIKDNGQGIDPALLAEGREGHFGLQGMRERASRIRSKLTVSSTAAGTEVTLIVPGAVVYRYEHPTLLHKLRETVRRLLHPSAGDDI
ncbi:sensor histidine kinase [Terriglobus albidus]|uniref:sensor histidine kinase n=1 Tax=Terriglobus albidus TaxID=1592106 RepID=UPI0021E07898|nr:sensor histidine kinase [Terriglobus albidus]